MIKQINYINDFGIYKNYTHNPRLDCFSRFNLFFGWNGSGKSTISRLMRMLSNRLITEDYSNCRFEVELEDGSKVTQSTLDNFPLKMFVFNQDFIDENINWDQVIKSILLISEEKIEDRKKLISTNEELKIKQDEYKKLREEIRKESNETNRFLSDIASKIKTQFQKIETDDKYYLNYNKTRIEQFLAANSSNIANIKNLSLDEIDTVIKSIKPAEKKQLIVEGIVIDKANLAEQLKTIQHALSSSYVAFAIEKLKDNSKLSNWVEQGLEIHRQTHSEYCEFCGNKVKKERLEELESHFNKEYITFKEKLIMLKMLINKERFGAIKYPHTNELYEEYQSEYNQLLVNISTTIEEVNLIIDDLSNKLTMKINDPFAIIPDIPELQEERIDFLLYNGSKLEGIITRHNEKTANFKEEVNKMKKALEAHLLKEALINFNFLSKHNTLRKKQTKLLQLKEDINKLENDVLTIETTLSNQFLGATEFNKRLHGFLGRKELSLRFDSDLKGYRIMRNEGQAKNLSEGEKTAIAFIYFITKLKENGNDISDSILIIDDPISSFDSNNLFHAYSFLKNECQHAKQLFILTHNFNFYKLLRDWLVKKNKNERNKPTVNKAVFYSIESFKAADDQRESRIVNANKVLLDYQSEYHYIFSKVYDFKDNQFLSLDEAFTVANLSRKLLEGFLSFKYPRKRNDFSQLMDASKCDGIVKDKIYKFINKYSHNQTIEFGDESIENLLGESQNVVLDIMQLIKTLDEEHYLEMVQVVEKTG